ncbi:hypothetical protein [Mesorhizobium sp. L-8-3]|uniref:hypothetical protein n=1 Tax=Mesorhizobium sp. L-8-3 TaxID=2744522 RepID=UPI001927F000|nr:hypothetical protein [Mesorhizobium sp. L-8-3]BCH24373.1 hypothetical protein MesoLjLb_41580 [Mesorhizobium sp. L-8-3]
MSEWGGTGEGLPGEIASALSGHGLILRGGFVFGEDEARPQGLSGAPATAVLLVGQAGATHWPHFLRWRQSRSREIADPLDSWSREAIGAVAEFFGARAVLPSDRPYLPFQQWAMRAEGLKPSPLGILMHPDYGLWHAYRGALLFDVAVAIEAPRNPIHLCDLCVGKPCLRSCPVDAHSEAGFAYGDCLRHVRSPSGNACLTGGCLDRNACPHGQGHRYPAELQALHMAAFAGAAEEF